MAYHTDDSCGPNSSPDCSMEEHIYILYIDPCVKFLNDSEPPSEQAEQIRRYLEALALCYLQRVNTTAERFARGMPVDEPHINAILKVIAAYDFISRYIHDVFVPVYNILHSTNTIRNDITVDNLYGHFTDFFNYYNLPRSELKRISETFYDNYVELLIDNGPTERCKSRLRDVNILPRGRPHPLLRLGLGLGFSNKLEVGTKSQVWKGLAKHTSNGLTKKDLTKNKNGNVVIKR